MAISIHKALASLDGGLYNSFSSHFDFNPQGSREPRHQFCQIKKQCHYFNPQGSREPRLVPSANFFFLYRFQSTRLSRASTVLGAQLNFRFWISIHKALASLDSKIIQTCSTSPPNILCIMLFSPQFNQFSPFTQPAFTAFSSVFQVRISQAFHVSLAFAPGLKGSQLTETNSTYILHNPSFPAYILHAAKPLPPPPDTLSIQASFVPDIWHPA